MNSRPSNAPVTLCRANLAALPSGVEPPGFAPSDIMPGMVHLGLGAFHRAHMARYTHELMEMDPDARQWGIVGAVLLPHHHGVIEDLHAQDGLYALVERENDRERVRVIAALAEVVQAGVATAGLLDVIGDPRIRIVSLTVTENGYCLDPATKRLDSNHPLVRADLAYPAGPRSAIGVITQALRLRRSAGLAPFTALSCDNIQGNGAVLRLAVLDLANLQEPDGELAGWIAAEVAFPSTMVDRITPVTTRADIDGLARRYNLADRSPVVCETFTQWVVEDRFPTGRPAWERVGAQFVTDVEPYEHMKLRLLNASHLAVSGLGRLSGCVTIADAMADARIAAVMTALMERETGPTLPPTPGIDLVGYKSHLLRRFADPAIRDTVDRVNTDAPLNLLLDPIRDRLAAGATVTFLALALAAWLRRVRGEDEHGAPIALRHPDAALLRARAVEGGPDPVPLLSIRHLFGDLGQDPGLIGPVAGWLAMIYGQGIERTLDEAAGRARSTGVELDRLGASI